jgi:putative phosphoribosyl transferase
MVRILEDPSLRNRQAVFQDRNQAGKRLAAFIQGHIQVIDPLVCAIPSGGVPIGLELAMAYHASMFLGIVRKLKVPWNPEAGFGSVTWDGEVFLNRDLVRALGLSDEDIRQAVQDTKTNIAQRIEAFSEGRAVPPLDGRTVVITDDGLASGYTMKAAIESVSKKQPKTIIVAVPTGSTGAVAVISGIADIVVCLNLKDGFPFAVADAYRNWYDLDDREVMNYLESAEKMHLL